ncbi:ABC transporter permease [Atopococcus tabaci]|uniref:ABC transporter permease n=1 Tax=Atopococcus tabaci TaxID=269774 RepID=UPI00240A4207|nr:ABC transporter permease [Atopococcus tabaci]
MKLMDFWKKRERTHQKKLFKYLKYVFNDHFVLLLLLILGAGGYGYSEYVKTLSPEAVFPRIVIWLLLFAALFVGRFATLLQPADMVFLLPLETEMGRVMQKLKRRSFILPASLLLLGSAAAMPLLVALGEAEFSHWLVVAGTLWILKDSELDWQAASLKIASKRRKNQCAVGIYGLFLLVLFLMVFVSVWTGLPVALAGNVGLRYFYKKVHQSNRLQWEEAIQTEKARLQRIYRFINLFTDIPALTDRPKRRKWADAFIQRIPTQKNSPYLYLYLRGFVRGSSYSGLFFQLTGIGAVLIWLVDWTEIGIAIGVIGLYLIGFQLIPLYYHFDESLLLRLYPLVASGKIAAVQKVLLLLLLITSGLFWAAGWISLGFMNSLYLLLAFSVFSCLFVGLYVPYRLKKKGGHYESTVE